MAELDVGSIYATLELHTQQVNQAADGAIQKIREVGTAAGQVPMSIQEEKIVAKIQKTSTALEDQRSKVAKLGAQLDAMADQYAALEKGAGRSGDFDLAKGFPALTAQYAKELSKMGQLQTSLRTLTREREQAAQKAVAAAQKQANAAESAAQKQAVLNQKVGDKTAYANMRVGTNIAISSLRTLSTTTGGAIGNISDLISQIVMMRETMRSATSAGAMLGAGIAGAVGVVANLVVTGINQIREAEEKRQQRFAEAIENTQRYAEELASIEKNVRVMNDATSTTEEVTQAKNALASSLDGVVIGYDNEGNAILASNKLLDEQIEKLRTKIQLEDQAAAAEYDTEKKSLESKEKEIDDKEKEIERLQRAIDGQLGAVYDERTKSAKKAEAEWRLPEAEKELIKLEGELLTAQSDFTKAFLAEFKQMYKGFYDLPMEYQSAVTSIILENENVMRSENGLAQMVELVNAQLEDRVASDAMIAQQQAMRQAAEETAASFSSFMGSLNDINSAYSTLREGEELSTEALYKLAAAYPEISRYIEQTGDLTLDYGRILEEVFSQRQQQAEQDRQDRIGELEDLKIKAKQKIAMIEEEARTYDALTDAKFRSHIMDKLADAKADLDNIQNTIDQLKAASTIAKQISFGGSTKKTGSSRNEALQNELKLLEHRKKMNQLTSEEELAWLNRLMKQYRLSADERQDLEYRIYQVKQKMREEEEKALQEQIKRLDDLGAAVVSALKARYEEQKKIEQNRINDSIKSWQKWEDETVSAIQGQIDALDDLEKQQDSADKRAEYERNKQALELQKAYEKDLYQREMIQKEINRLDAEEQKRLEQEARDQLREQLQQQIEDTRKESSAKQDALKEELNKLDDTYAELTKTAALTAEAERTMMQASQEEILQLLHSYAPEYEVAGQSLGEKLVAGFTAKMGPLGAFFDNLQARITSFNNQVAAVANQAADNFWANRAAEEARIAAQAAPTNIQMTVNFNQPVESPIEIRRELEKVMQQMAVKIQQGG